MRNSLLALMLWCNLIAFGQQEVFNRTINLKLGYSWEQFTLQNLIKEINDTSLSKFEMVSQTPTISYTHEYTLNPVISLAGNVGFQYMNVFYKNQHFGSPYFWISIAPKITLFSRERFEYYMKLHLGGSFWRHDLNSLSDHLRKFFPERANFFTGITLGGFNYFFKPKWGLNLELSVFSPQMVEFGLTYRFYKGKLPDIQGNEQAKTNL